MTRPPVPFPSGAGFEWRVFIDRDWRALSPIERHGWTCRHRASKSATCRRQAVAALDRNRSGPRPKWYGYCERHLYGRWIERVGTLDVVAHWRLRAVDAAHETDEIRTPADRLLELAGARSRVSTKYVAFNLKVSRKKAIEIMRAAGFVLEREGKASRWRPPV